MDSKPTFDYRAAGLDEKKIDEILSKPRCDEVVFRLDRGIAELNPAQQLAVKAIFQKFYDKQHPEKTRGAGPFDSIIRHLSALIGNKHLSEDHRRKYTVDREYYRTMQKENRELNQPKGKKMFAELVERDQVYDLVKEIHKTRKGSATLSECFDLAAQVWNAKKGETLTALRVKSTYWNTYK